jgi:hypothetical protein
MARHRPVEMGEIRAKERRRHAACDAIGGRDTVKKQTRIVLAVLLALSAPTGCGEDTPEGRELASPAEREAAPAPEELEASGREEPEPGDTGDAPE